MKRTLHNHPNPKNSLRYGSTVGGVVIGLIAAIVVGFPQIAESAFSDAPSTINPGTYGSVDPTSPLKRLDFLNTSAQTQGKLGTLIIGGSGACPLSDPKCSVICLNAADSTERTAVSPAKPKCISSWSDIGVTVGGNYVHLSTPITGGIGRFGNYPTVDSGYLYLRSSATQPLTLNALNTNTAGGAIYGETTSSSQWAAVFRDSIFVGGGSAKLCLNGQTTWNADTKTGECITRWNGLISNSGLGYLRRQQQPYTPQTGQVALDDAVALGTLSVGDPNQITAANYDYAKGDGLCSAAFETAANSAIDCAPVSTLTFTASRPTATTATLNISGATVGNIVVIVRQKVASPEFTPTDGVVFDDTTPANRDLGSAYVVYSKVASTSSFSVPDSGLTVGQPYTYFAAQGNAFPRYSTVAKASI